MKFQIVQVIDDLSHELLDEDESDTVEFGIDDKHYSIDLALVSAEDLRSIIRRYVELAREVTSGGSPRGTSQMLYADPRVIRDWASRNGFVVAKRGRLADEVIQAYFTSL